MTDQLRLGTLGDEILQTGVTIPVPLAGDGMTVPIPASAFGDDLPLPPPPHYGGGEPAILNGGISIPTP